MVLTKFEEKCLSWFLMIWHQQLTIPAVKVLPLMMYKISAKAICLQMNHIDLYESLLDEEDFDNESDENDIEKHYGNIVEDYYIYHNS